jgi:hypothetical protein
MTTPTPLRPHADAPAGQDTTSWRRLAGHYVEMVLAMLAGMLLLGGLRSATGLTVPFTENPVASYLLMAVDMSVGMAAWMRFRGHGWAVTLEMCAAMFVPVVLLPAVLSGAMAATTFMVTAHVLMPLAMLAVLLRRRRDHHAHR